MNFLVVLAAISCLIASVYSQPSDACLKCLAKVESNCNPNVGCVFDVYSDSCGCWQIKEAYWIDGGRLGGSWRTCANDKACAKQTVINYLKRYGKSCTGAATITCADYARIHNGGPSGCSYSSTATYASKVNTCLAAPPATCACM